MNLFNKGKIKVVSLFDGMSCGQIALNKESIEIEEYFAAEIDKYAMQITMKNYPNTIQLGDVTKVKGSDLPKIDLLIGGSPCQGFSFAGKQLNFKDPRSALFFEYVRILKELREINPNIKFLLENVRMKKEFQDVISEYLGVKPIAINSSLLSAQNRYRLYWTNIDGVEQPVDKKIYLKDIIEKEVDEKYYLSDLTVQTLIRHKNKIISTLENPEKSATICAGYYKMGGRDQQYVVDKLLNLHKKALCISGSTAYSVRNYNRSLCNFIGEVKETKETKDINSCVQIGTLDIKGMDCIKRIYSIEGKCPTLSTMQGGNRQPKIEEISLKIRRLTPLECERLQTVPDNYTEGVSNSQRYKMLGNGWTVDVIAHIFKNLKN